MNTLTRFKHHLLNTIGLINTALVLSPQLNSPYKWDDYTISNIKGAAVLHHWNVFDAMGAATQGIFVGQARFFPISSLCTLFLYYLNRFQYKLAILALILVNVFLLGQVVAKLSNSKNLGTLT